MIVIIITIIINQNQIFSALKHIRLPTIHHSITISTHPSIPLLLKMKY